MCGVMKKIFKLTLIISVILLLAAGALYLLLPDPREFLTKNPGKTSFMKMRIRAAKAEGKHLRISHRYISYSEISQDLKDAVRISEDGAFFLHNGFDFAEIKLSIKANLKKGGFKRGGSTITQQLAKNLYLSSDKTIRRKLKEAVLTYKLEQQLPKRRIFELYLNYIELGKGVFGVETASRIYFHKSAARLTTFESVRLACIIPNPRRFSPNRPTRRLKHKSFVLLKRMYKFRKLTRREYGKALAEFRRFFN